jgi:hypothetical protein
MLMRPRVCAIARGRGPAQHCPAPSRLRPLIRGHRNKTVDGRMRSIVERWAEHAEITIEQYAW